MNGAGGMMPAAGNTPQSAGDRSRLGATVILLLSAGLLAAVWMSLASGPTGFMPLRALTVLQDALIGATQASAPAKLLSWSKSAPLVPSLQCSSARDSLPPAA
jgi:hypothetical protein